MPGEREAIVTDLRSFLAGLPDDCSPTDLYVAVLGALEAPYREDMDAFARHLDASRWADAAAVLDVLEARMGGDHPRVVEQRTLLALVRDDPRPEVPRG